MENAFEILDLGLMKYFLGIEVHQCKAGIFIFQVKYVSDVIKKDKLENCKEVAIP